MNLTIRPLEEQDYLEMLSLWNNELENKMVTKENIASYYIEMSTDSRYKTFVAENHDQILGFITSVNSMAVGLDNGFLHITGLAVKQQFQGQGVGRKLLAYLENYAQDIQVHSIILNSGTYREKAHRFYELNGYSKDSYCFDKTI